MSKMTEGTGMGNTGSLSSMQDPQQYKDDPVPQRGTGNEEDRQTTGNADHPVKSGDNSGNGRAAQESKNVNPEKEEGSSSVQCDGSGVAGDTFARSEGYSVGIPDHSFKASLKAFFTSWRGIVAVLIIIACVAVPVVWLKAVKPAMDRRALEEDPVLRKSTAAIVPYAHEWRKVKLNASTVDNTDVNEYQYLLKWKDSRAGSSSCMTFHAVGEDDPKHTIKVTMAFDDSKSRDFFDAQKPVLEQAMRSGKAKVQVCMLLTSDEYSALAIEALGEIDYNDPGNTWDALNALSKVDVSSLTTGDKRLDAIMNVVNSLPNSSAKVTIRKESLRNGSFLQWARVMSNASQVEKIPALWIDSDNLSSSDKFRINNPDALFQKIDALP